jgi:hypothetical protein
MPFTGGQAKQLNWPGAGQARFTGTIEGGPIPQVSYDGLWAAFHLFADAEVSQPAGAGFNFEYPIKVAIGKTSREIGRARFYVEPWYFRKGAIQSCPTPVAK